MPENMMCTAHKAGNKNYLNNFDSIFKKKRKKKDPIKATKKEIEEYKRKCVNNISDRIATLAVEAGKRFEHWKTDIHPSHKMIDWYTDIRSPVGTARFYSCRECEVCGYEQSYAAAGRFKDHQLTEKCHG